MQTSNSKIFQAAFVCPPLIRSFFFSLRQATDTRLFLLLGRSQAQKVYSNLPSASCPRAGCTEILKSILPRRGPEDSHLRKVLSYPRRKEHCPQDKKFREGNPCWVSWLNIPTSDLTCLSVHSPVMKSPEPSKMRHKEFWEVKTVDQKGEQEFIHIPGGRGLQLHRDRI